VAKKDVNAELLQGMTLCRWARSHFMGGMYMKIGSTGSLGLHFQLSQTSSAISRSLQRLSTGRRVNGPGDDPAAYSVGVTFEGQIRGLTQANLNINQTQGLIQTADSAFESQLDILQRMREIAVQASSSTLTLTERENLNTELQGLLDEYRRIALDTEFNGRKLIDGTFSTTSFQIGANSDETLEFSVNSTYSTDVFRKDVGSGTFQTRTTLVGGTGPYAMATGDIDGDGNVDLIASEVGSSNNQAVLAIYRGNGDGTFLSRVTIAGGTDSRDIQLVDVSGDGVLDIITSDYDDSTVSVFKGNGDGSFQTRVTYAAGTNPRGVRVGDVNNDGDVDIVVADNGAGAGNTVSILLGNGDGSFLDRSTLLTGTGPTDIALADFNGDGNLDIVTANNQGTTSGSSVYYGTGSGTFVIQATLTTGADAFSVTSGDWNGDGHLDLAFLNQTGAGTVTTFVNNGAGVFTNGATLTVTTTTERIRAGDINNDGLDDLISANQGSNNLSLFISSGNGSFTTGTTVTTGTNEGGYDVHLVDVDNDGVLDIVTPSSGASGGTSFSGISIVKAISTNVSANADITVATYTKAQQLIEIVDGAIASLNEERANISALHNRLEQGMALNLLLIDDYGEAMSKAVDVDVALETAELVRNQVLQQAQVAVAAQANLQMQTVLGLLRF